MDKHSTTTGPVPPTKEPSAVFRFGNVSAAIFPDVTKTGTVWNVSVRRSYRDAEGKWQHTHSLTPSDLLPAALALTKSYEHIANVRSEDRK